MRRVVVPGGEETLVALLELFPGGVEELGGGFVVYTDDGGEQILRERFPDATATAVAEGWEEAWRDFHHGVVVGRFWVGPPWEEAPPGLEPVVIDPGRAFGTGAHATTRLALELLQSLRPGSLVDVGCGSGVLAIAAARLGFAPVLALDVEPDAVETTVRNAAVNGVEIAARSGDALVDALPPADVVVANVSLDVVERLLPRLDARLAVVSGYLERDEPRAESWRRVERRDREGWAVDLFEREST